MSVVSVVDLLLIVTVPLIRNATVVYWNAHNSGQTISFSTQATVCVKRVKTLP